MADLILTVGRSPHIKSGANIVHNHYMMSLALLPAVAAAVMLHGIDAVAIILLSVTTVVSAEALAQFVFKQPIYALDGHAVLMGLTFALLMPPTAPLWMVFIGAIMLSVVAKQIFGGLGCPFNPAMIAYVILLSSWPLKLSPVGGITLGTSCVHAVLLGGVIIWVLGFIDRLTPLVFLAGVFISAMIFHSLYPETVAPVYDYFFSGHVFLAAFFLITDESSSPANLIPKLMYGLLVGVMVIIIRVYGVWPEVIPFAVLLGNLFGPLFDRLKPKPITSEGTHE